MIKHAATVRYPNGNIVSYHYDDESETPYAVLEEPDAVNERIAAIKRGDVVPKTPDIETVTALVASLHKEETRARAELSTLDAELTAKRAEKTRLDSITTETTEKSQ